VIIIVTDVSKGEKTSSVDLLVARHIERAKIPVLDRRGNAMRFFPRIALGRRRDLCTAPALTAGLYAAGMNCILGIETHARLMHRLTTAGFRERSRIGYAPLFIFPTKSLRFIGKEEKKRTCRARTGSLKLQVRRIAVARSLRVAHLSLSLSLFIFL